MWIKYKGILNLTLYISHWEPIDDLRKKTSYSALKKRITFHDKHHHLIQCRATYIDFHDRNNKRIKIDGTKEEVFHDK